MTKNYSEPYPPRPPPVRPERKRPSVNQATFMNYAALFAHCFIECPDCGAKPRTSCKGGNYYLCCLGRLKLALKAVRDRKDRRKVPKGYVKRRDQKLRPNTEEYDYRKIKARLKANGMWLTYTTYRGFRMYALYDGQGQRVAGPYDWQFMVSYLIRNGYVTSQST